MGTKRQLVIIPGLGDREWLYRFIKPLWALFGFEVHIFVYGWNDEHTPLKEAQNRLNAFIGALDEKPFIIGVSAGGTAAINVLAGHPETVAKVVTVCTPYALVSHFDNKLLNQSVRQVARSLAAMDYATKTKVLSLHGLYDQVVPVVYSQPEGIKAKHLIAAGHGLSIMAALVLYGCIIRSFFKA